LGTSNKQARNSRLVESVLGKLTKNNMYSVYVKNHKPKKKDDYQKAMENRIKYVQDRQRKEQEEKAKLKYF
jgi:hypothetical protein